MAPLSSVHTRTPTLSVVDPRGLAVRQIAFCRTQPGEDASVRINRSAHDVAGRLVRSWDPRLWLVATNDPTSHANLNVIHSLTGQVLHSQHVDAGWSLELLGEAGQRHLRRDAQGHGQRVEYDQLLRPVAVFDSDEGAERCLERLTYGGPEDGFANQCGQLIRHDDPAGSVINAEFGLTGAVLEQTRRFLKDLETPDWPEDLGERDEWLEPGDGAATLSRFSAAGEMIEQTDAIGAVRLFESTVGGQPSRSTLQLPDQARQTLMRNIRYDAQGRAESETAGNGHVTERTYDLADGRLRRQQVDNGRFQDLTYATDPVGNIVSIKDLAQPTRFFANQQIDPLRTFVYDTLYQLTEATGYEAATLNRGPQTAQRTFATADQLSNYTQRYEYDAGGNLQKLTHSGTQKHTRLFATAHLSNRSLLQTDERPPTQEQIAAGFDANGNLRELAPGQALSWDLRNQLSEVTPVERESGVNDREVYQYDASGARVRKIRLAQAKAQSHSVEVRYLPGLEIRINSATGEVLHVITATAGHSTVRVLHWQAGKPVDIDNDQTRYSLADHIGSSTLEVDQKGQLISQEVYYPYGETAWFAARNDVEAKYKTVRYSGKERDTTGLYYYGLRYYAPWLMRWLNPDPKGDVDGLNRFAFVRGNPVSAYDSDGGGMLSLLFGDDDPPSVNDDEYLNGLDEVERALLSEGYDLRYRSTEAMEKAGEFELIEWIDTALETAAELVSEDLNNGLGIRSFVQRSDPSPIPNEKLIEDVRNSVAVGYSHILKQIQRYQPGGDLRQSFVYVPRKVGSPSDTVAFVLRSVDEEKQRIFITDLWSDYEGLAAAMIMVHEISHHVLSTDDIFYYGDQKFDLSSKDSYRNSALQKVGANTKLNLQRAAYHKEINAHPGFIYKQLLGNADFWANLLLTRGPSEARLNKLYQYGVTQKNRSLIG